jgi:hypothetical protein
MKNILLNISGIGFPLGFSLYGLLEKATPIFSFIGIVVSIGVGISALIVNKKRAGAYDRQRKIDEEILFKK